MTRQNARLRMLLASERRERERQTGFSRRLLRRTLLAPKTGLLRLPGSGAPSQKSARPVWSGWNRLLECRVPSAEGRLCPYQPRRSAHQLPRNPPATGCRAPAESAGTHCALVQLWSDHGPADLQERLVQRIAQGAWESWAMMVADRGLLEHGFRPLSLRFAIGSKPRKSA